MSERREYPNVIDEGVLHLPPVDDDDGEEAFDHIIWMCEGLPAAPTYDREDAPSEALDHMHALESVVSFIESLLEDDQGAVAPVRSARLALMCMYPSITEAVVVQVAFGRAIGEENSRKWWGLIAEAQRRGITVDEHVARLVADDDIPNDRVYRLFRGEEAQVPDAARVRRGIVVLRQSAALVPEPFRASMLCGLAWLQWARGKRAIAMAYLSEATRIEPDHILAYGLAAQFDARMPVWLNG